MTPLGPAKAGLGRENAHKDRFHHKSTYGPAMNITRSIVSERDRALLSGDYAVYHAQATRRIHKLRRQLGNATPKGRKYVPKTAVTAENVASNAEWVQLLLASSERAWADAMAMKQSQSPETTQKRQPSSTKRQIVSRLQRAIVHAKNLVDIVQARPGAKNSPTDLLEAKAYLAMLRGTKHFEQSRWQPCMEQYALVRLVYVVLGESAHTDLYRELLSTTVEPSIRYAAYQLKIPRTKPITDIVIEHFPTNESDAKATLIQINPSAFQTTSDLAAASDTPKDIPTHILWRNHKVKLEDATIAQALALAHQHEATLNDQFTTFGSGTIDDLALAASYDDVITARQEAADATKSALDELAAEGVDPGDRRMQSLQITRTAVHYAVIEFRIGRNRVLCGVDDGLKFETVSHQPWRKSTKSSKQPTPEQESIGRRISRLRERVALYDAILQSLDSTQELPGVVADESFVAELSGKRSYFRALKCLAIGRSHALNAETTSALALYNRALGLAQDAQAALSNTSTTSSGAPKLDISSTVLTATTTHLEQLVIQHRALCDLKSATTSSAGTTAPGSKPPLIQQLHLNQYYPNVDLSNIVNYPVKLHPIPVKPLFFDIAWNYIQYPGHGHQDGQSLANGHELERKGSPSRETDDKPAAKRGWFGFGRS
ncbi:hypothetical protein DV736_g1950, partial [Chaetothyriales sp. CBS 134916]